MQTTRITSPTCLNDTFDSFEPKRLLRPKFSKNTVPTSTSVRFKSSIRVRAVQCENLVEPVGIEPTTPCLQSRCSPS